MTATEYAQLLIDAPDLKAYRAISNTPQRDETIKFGDVCSEQIRLDREAHPWPVIVETGELKAMTDTKRCRRWKNCVVGGDVFQSAEEFETRRGACRACRESGKTKLAARQQQTATGVIPQRVFVLAPHHELANGTPEFATGSDYFGEPDGLKLFRAPTGQPVTRRHDDLGPGEVGWVLG